MSIVLVGSTSGSCTLQEQAVAGTSVLTLPVGTGTVVANNVNSAIVSGTSVASTSGTSIDFTGIPSWVKRITVMFDQVSTNGTSLPAIQLGDSGGIEATGYNTGSSLFGATGIGTTIFTTSFTLRTDALATVVMSGHVILNLMSSSTNTWSIGGVLATPTAGTYMTAIGGTKSLSATLDRVRITTVNGTDAFDSGSINILYE